jgi:hypothetical protein
MAGGNGDVAREFPARMGEALRAARSGHHVSLEVLRGAVCSYMDELVATNLHSDAEIRDQVFAAFQDVNAETTHGAGSALSNDLVDELITWCRDREPRM